MSIRIGTFTVPVDLYTLQACRKSKGFVSARQLHDHLRGLGYDLNYRVIEQPDRHGGERRIKSASADIIAHVLGVEPDTVFPQYSHAKQLAEQIQMAGRYKPFSNIEERNRSIVEHYEVARKAAWSLRWMFRNPNNGRLFVEMDDLYSIALETLVEEADKALHYGLLDGYSFTAHVVLSIKSEFYRLRREEQNRRQFYITQSLETYMETFEVPSPIDIEDVVGIKDEAWRAIQALSRKKQNQAKMRDLIMACFPGMRYV